MSHVVTNLRLNIFLNFMMHSINLLIFILLDFAEVKMHMNVNDVMYLFVVMQPIVSDLLSLR